MSEPKDVGHLASYEYGAAGRGLNAEPRVMPRDVLREAVTQYLDLADLVPDVMPEGQNTETWDETVRELARRRERLDAALAAVPSESLLKDVLREALDDLSHEAAVARAGETPSQHFALGIDRAVATIRAALAESDSGLTEVDPEHNPGWVMGPGDEYPWFRGKVPSESDRPSE
jgi:hypothetical protein